MKHIISGAEWMPFGLDGAYPRHPAPTFVICKRPFTFHQNLPYCYEIDAASQQWVLWNHGAWYYYALNEKVDGMGKTAVFELDVKRGSNGNWQERNRTCKDDSRAFGNIICFST